MERFRVKVTKDHLVFSAAHFITIGGSFCERLHGHNWRVAAEVAGPLDENEYVFDFIALRDTLQELVNQLDHRMLLPTQHPQIRVEESNGEVTATYDNRRWVFPAEECILLPVKQTTAELIAKWIGERFLEKNDVTSLTLVSIGVEENFGQWAIWEKEL